MSTERYKEKLVGFYQRNKRMPGYKEMMDLFDFKSKNSVYKLINKLVDEGVVEKDSRGKITPLNLYGELKVLGSVQAGIPTYAEEEFSETMSLDEYVVGKNRKSHFILTVSGDSMVGAGIHEGDLVIVERAKSAQVGDIVIASVDGDWTMKYLRKGKTGSFYLEAANIKYKDIYPEEEMTIGGIVRGVLRKY